MRRTPQQEVEYRVFKQTRTEGDVTTYEVVDRISPGTNIVASYGTAEEADAHRDRLREQHLRGAAR